MNAELKQTLRYGENPHQSAAYYSFQETCNSREPQLSESEQLQGKELSFNNLLDFEGALNCLKDFNKPCAVIVKHNNPCGIAVNDHIENAFTKAWEADSLSAFGSVIAVNEEITVELAQKLSTYFIEGIIAPSISDKALQILSSKKNLRILINKKLKGWSSNKIFNPQDFDYKRISGGILTQSRDLSIENLQDARVVTRVTPDAEIYHELDFAWKVVKHVKSNAIVFAKNGASVGIGAGQMSRVDALKIAMQKAGAHLNGCVIASDAFFPFRDSIDQISNTGIRAIIQPGGSVRDQEVIDACDEFGIPMIFTGIRHFKH